MVLVYLLDRQILYVHFWYQNKTNPFIYLQISILSNP